MCSEPTLSVANRLAANRLCSETTGYPKDHQAHIYSARVMNKQTLTSQLDQFALRSHRMCCRMSHRNSRHPIQMQWVRIDMA